MVRNDYSYYFILIDIDEFKYINDSFGYFVGDVILVEFSDVLKDVFSVKVYICRFGGDEFVIYLYDYELEEVNGLIKKLVNILENYLVIVILNDYRFKFSYGFIKIELFFDFSKVYEILDKKLYEYKVSKNDLRR